MLKQVFTALFLTTLSAIGFAQDGMTQAVLPVVRPLEVKPVLPLDAKVEVNRSFTYLRMGVSDSQPVENVELLPGFGLGYRLERGTSAFDFSASYNRHDYTVADSYFFTVPKVNYIYYLGSEVSNNSVYLGGGAAWGGIGTSDGRTFLGVIPNLSVGFEMNRNVRWRSFVQLDVSHAVDYDFANYKNLPGALLEVSLGGGF